MTATDELKPCPFCGGKALVIRDYCTSYNICVFEDFYVGHWCKLFPTRMVTKKFATEAEAIAAWNRRAGDE